jgi:ABC-2 type transport system permease protein
MKWLIIARFEARYQSMSMRFLTWFAIFFLCGFAAIHVEDEAQMFGYLVNLNSPYSILNLVAALLSVAPLLSVAFVASSVLRDDETRFAHLVYVTPINRFDYLFGRFLGGYVVSVLVFIGALFGIAVATFMPWLNTQRVDSFLFAPYIYATLVFVVPSIFVMGAIVFAVACKTRSIKWCYVSIFAILILYIVSNMLLQVLNIEFLAAILNPTVEASFEVATKYWTIAERNSLMPQTFDVIFYNRVVWVVIGTGFLSWAMQTFKLQLISGPENAANIDHEINETPSSIQLNSNASNFKVATSSLKVGCRQGLELFMSELRAIFKGWSFVVLLILFTVLTLVGMSTVTSVETSKVLPANYLIINYLNNQNSLISLFLGLIFTAELVWRDRDCRIHEIVNALPVSDVLRVVPKLLAIVFVPVIVSALSIVIAAFYQYKNSVEPNYYYYLIGFVIPFCISFYIWTAICLAIQIASPSRLVGYCVTIVFAVLVPALLVVFDFDHRLYLMGEMPFTTLSDMNGIGHFWIARAWYQLYWSLFCVFLLLLVFVLGGPSLPSSIKNRSSLAKRHLRSPLGLAAGIAGFAWVATGAFIFYNTNYLNKYERIPTTEQRAADSEKALTKFENIAQPKVISVDAKIDLFPDQRLGKFDGTYRLKNQTKESISQIFVHFDADLQVQHIALENAVLDKEYLQFQFRIFKLLQPMEPDTERTLSFRSQLYEPGFKNDQGQTSIIENGSFINNFQFTPTIGVNRMRWLSDPVRRLKYGLPADQALAKLGSIQNANNNYIRGDSDWIDLNLSVSTQADQVPIAPGTVVSDQTKDGRRTIITRSDSPILNFFSIQSGRYQLNSQAWVSPSEKENAAQKPIDLTIYHHPEHARNIEKMHATTQASLSYFASAFGPYQFDHARIIEFPSYLTFAQAFAGTVAFSEGAGFIQRGNSSALLSSFTAHEIAHQWWAHQLIGANQQGQTLLSESLAEYSAFQVLKKLRSYEELEVLLNLMKDTYLKGRARSKSEEVPLIHVSNQTHLMYSKGGLAFIWLGDVVGQEKLDKALSVFLKQYAFKSTPYPTSADLIRVLRSELGKEHELLITDLFEKITFYELSAEAPQATVLPNTDYEITLNVRAKKFHADGKGVQLPSPIDEIVEIGVFDGWSSRKTSQSIGTIKVIKVRITQDSQPVKFTVRAKPGYVAVDPFRRLFSRDQGDNAVKVKALNY